MTQFKQSAIVTWRKAENSLLDVQTRVEHYLGCPLDSDHLIEVAFVRNVAPNKAGEFILIELNRFNDQNYTSVKFPKYLYNFLF